MKSKNLIIFLLASFCFFAIQSEAQASYHFGQFRAHPPIHTYGSANVSPAGITPEQIKKIYHLPESGGQGAIAIIDAYDSPDMEHDFNVFNKQFNLPACTTVNGCFEKHKMSSTITKNSGWSFETALDVEWAHAIAPNAKIILVEAKTPSGQNLLDAIDYARKHYDYVTGLGSPLTVNF
jgi:subtilase family serine protease